MQRTQDVVTLTGAALLHAGLALGLVHAPLPRPHAPQLIELTANRPPPPPPLAREPASPAPAPPPPTVPVRKRAVKRRAVAAPPSTPPPNRTPPAPPTEPPKPVFGVTMDSLTDGPSSFAVPTGNTTLIDPAAATATTARPLPPAPSVPAAPPAHPYKPVSPLHIRTLPEVDTDACGRGIPYPKEARELGIQGDVVLRVELDEQGQVHAVAVVSGLGHGLDQAAVQALKSQCRFKPAVAADGTPASFVIPAYTFHFELPK